MNATVCILIRSLSDNIRSRFVGRKIWSKSKVFAKFNCILVILTTVTNAAIAESSGLSGLGEPAAPESLAHPDQLFPNNATDRRISASSYSSTPGSMGNSNNQLPIYLHPKIEQTAINKPFTFNGAVQYSQQSYPQILKDNRKFGQQIKMSLSKN
ncbi:MAG: hypothetical protein WDN66_04560 [Candidatus Saccharibacteria bacterium]